MNLFQISSHKKDFVFCFISLLPHRVNSHDGKKHVRTVPVRLRKAQHDEHSKHEGLFIDMER